MNNLKQYEKDETLNLLKIVDDMNRLHAEMGGRDGRPERKALVKCMRILDAEIKRSREESEMKFYPNIEHHRNSDGSRTGYDATGRSWRIFGKSGSWTARANVTVQGLLHTLIGYETLDQIAQELKRIGK